MSYEKDVGVVLFVDGANTARGLSEILKEKEIKTDLLDPTYDITQPVGPQKLMAIVYEPLFSFSENERFRPIIDGLLERAGKDNATRVALTSMSREELEEGGFLEGQHYDFYFRKPEHVGNIVNCIAQRYAERGLGKAL